MTVPLGLYVHIPFCHARCGYCDFVTFTGKDDQVDVYVTDLCREIAMYGKAVIARSEATWQSQTFHTNFEIAAIPEVARDDCQRITTIFFGGGTPSVLEPRHIQSIFHTIHQSFDLSINAEITIEANPESITPEKAKSWRMAGINRASIGLQAFDDQLLKDMGRLHTVAGFIQGYQLLREAGFDNLSIDLIYGFPNQSLASWKDTIQKAAALQPEHISLYSLKVEDHTPFAQAGVLINEDLQADMYDVARTILAKQGLEQYEISNFARPGRACNHNLIYWRQQDYLGVGVGAVGCVGGIRWQNVKSLPQYHQSITSNQKPKLSEEQLDPNTQKFERLMLGLRLREGIPWDQEDNPLWLSERSRLATKGHLEEILPGRWRIPDTLVPLTNQILLPFL